MSWVEGQLTGGGGGRGSGGEKLKHKRRYLIQSLRGASWWCVIEVHDRNRRCLDVAVEDADIPVGAD